MINIKDQEFLNAFGAHLKVVRKAKGFTQESLAYAADLTLSQIGRIERGETNPTICTIKVIAVTLKVELKELMDIPLQ